MCSTRPFAPPRSPRSRGSSCRRRRTSPPRKPRPSARETVATRTAEPGEVITAGTPVITLVNLAEVYLRAFVPEGQIGRVRLSQPARVYLDSDPAKPIDAYVLRIDPQASFTPENTYFREDRVKQVIGVKLRLRGAVGFAKPGMPADGEILVDGGQWPLRPTHR
ncbi:MAG: hypothetical protein DMD88_21620 [Candidatus Rokuibacteriota bacterium]|nr:MAG: hypothetical protein DMD88_21620 [Candidatus Rokubacteria bacterium]